MAQSGLGESSARLSAFGARRTWRQRVEDRSVAIDPVRPSGRIRGTGFMERLAILPTSLRLDARELDHPGPFLRFSCDVSAELRGGENHGDRADLGEP